MDLCKRVKNFIKKSNISENDKHLWYSYIDKTPEANLILLLNLFLNAPEHFSWLTENLKKKIKIIEKNDKSGLKILLQEEKEKLQSIIDKEEIEKIRKKL